MAHDMERSHRMADEQLETPVCVVEDDTSIRETLRDLLQEEGYRVLEASNGSNALELLKGASERLVVLLDHKLPEMDGCDLLDIVAHDNTLRERHVFILVTASPAHAEEDCGETLEELGAPLLAKPFGIDEVLEAVAEAAQRITVG
jgi:CheY-like chemotaxis protein